MRLGLVERGLELLYPARCAGCGAFGSFLCRACEPALRRADAGPRCPLCRARWAGPLNCPRCFGWRALDACVAAFDMEGTARRLVHLLKYRAVRTVAPIMACHIARATGDWRPDMAFAVPMHRRRQRARGFNQADVILQALGWPSADGRLVRRRATHRQVGMRQRERVVNVSGAFAYAGPDLRGLSVALVDDVVTTGATADECARLLRESGAATITVVAFARANFDPHDDGPIVD